MALICRHHPSPRRQNRLSAIDDIIHSHVPLGGSIDRRVPAIGMSPAGIRRIDNRLIARKPFQMTYAWVRHHRQALFSGNIWLFRGAGICRGVSAAE